VPLCEARRSSNAGCGSVFHNSREKNRDSSKILIRSNIKAAAVGESCDRGHITCSTNLDKEFVQPATFPWMPIMRSLYRNRRLVCCPGRGPYLLVLQTLLYLPHVSVSSSERGGIARTLLVSNDNRPPHPAKCDVPHVIVDVDRPSPPAGVGDPDHNDNITVNFIIKKSLSPTRFTFTLLGYMETSKNSFFTSAHLSSPW
jgi:hypothetical protein